MSTQQTAAKATLSVENIGGISETEVTFSPGVTILAGENATNRTSLLQAIMAVLGSDDVSVKGDMDEARVELDLDGETYTRKLVRQDSMVQSSGDPYLDDPTRADLFACLIDANDARRAVTNDEDLRDIIMRPVDTDEIKREIEALTQRRRDIEDELDALDSLKDRLPTLEERKSDLQDTIEAKKQELAATEAELADTDADVEQSRDEHDALDQKLADLRSTRATLEDVRYDIDTERESLESVRAELRDVEQALDDIPDAPIGEIDEMESRVQRLRDQKNTLESDISEIQNIIRFNEEMLDGASDGSIDVLNQDSETVSDELLPDGDVTCWTCGTQVSRDQIDRTVDHLRERSQTKLGDVNDIDAQLDELTKRIQDVREHHERREHLERRQTTLEAEISQGEETIERLTERRESLHAEIEALETDIEEMENETYEDILELHTEANQLEYELGRVEGDLEDVQAEIDDIEARLDQESELQVQLEQTTDDIDALRTKIERIETAAIEQFNEHMEEVLDLLEYRNLERIWLERVETEVRDGRRTVTKGAFELHVIRESEGGAVYEDTVDHLSESEREVLGLIFALAGYLVHEVYETVPFMLLDSLESIDANRIAALVEYIAEYSEYLVVALLPEDAAAIDSDYERITDI